MMDEKRELKKRIEASNFAENNGAMIRVINILDGDWIRLATIKRRCRSSPKLNFGIRLPICKKKDTSTSFTARPSS